MIVFLTQYSVIGFSPLNLPFPFPFHFARLYSNRLPPPLFPGSPVTWAPTTKGTCSLFSFLSLSLFSSTVNLLLRLYLDPSWSKQAKFQVVEWKELEFKYAILFFLLNYLLMWSYFHSMLRWMLGVINLTFRDSDCVETSSNLRSKLRLCKDLVLGMKSSSCIVHINLSSFEFLGQITRIRDLV